MKRAAIYARVFPRPQPWEKTTAIQTAALSGFTKTHQLLVPKERVFEEEGFGGAMPERPDLERIRDLAAEGQTHLVLAWSPDQLNRKYAYQFLLMDKLARQGIETPFVNAPQRMIAAHNRARLLGHAGRGKWHRVCSRRVSVLSGAPYGYRHIPKGAESSVSYVVLDAGARVLPHVYEQHTVEGFRIGEIVCRRNAEAIPTREQGAHWERSVVRAMLRNPAYRGAGGLGKTNGHRLRATRVPHRCGGTIPRNDVGHERPPEEWIEIPGFVRVSEDCSARVQELLHDNTIRSRRHTITPRLLQGLVSCLEIGYARSRTSICTSARKIQFHRCIGSDRRRERRGSVCDNWRLVRQDFIDQIVWVEVVRSLKNPELIQQELYRRPIAARSSDPTKKRELSLQCVLTLVSIRIGCIFTGYQEYPLSPEQLHERMPALRRCAQTFRVELRAIADKDNDRTHLTSLAETFTALFTRLHDAAGTIDIIGGQRIIRLVFKENSSAMTASLFSTESRPGFRVCRPTAHARRAVAGKCQTAEIIFCVRGVAAALLDKVVTLSVCIPSGLTSVTFQWINCNVFVRPEVSLVVFGIRAIRGVRQAMDLSSASPPAWLLSLSINLVTEAYSWLPVMVGLTKWPIGRKSCFLTARGG
ncbi:MAG: recombinase family protein [Acidobacteriaceae bacterium]